LSQSNAEVRSIISLKIKNTMEKNYEEICRVANRNFRVRWIGSSEDQLLSHLRPFPDLH